MCRNSMARVLVQGSSRGVGLQFCKTLLSGRPHVQLIATCRRPDDAMDLQGLRQRYADRMDILQVDVTDESQIKAAANVTDQKYGGLDLLINCAGMLHPSGRGETSLRDVHMEGLVETSKLNAFGPLLMGKHFGRLLQSGNGSIVGDRKERAFSGVLVNISAKVGSITDNGLGGWYSYRMSKSALNMATRNLSIELGRGKSKIVCVSLHPGTVDTDLSRPYHKNVKTLFTTEYCVDQLLSVIDSLTLEDSGKFFTYNKEELPF